MVTKANAGPLESVAKIEGTVLKTLEQLFDQNAPQETINLVDSIGVDVQRLREHLRVNGEAT